MAPEAEGSINRIDHWTVARIAQHLGVPRHRVEYVIETRGINPAAWVGHARVFDPADVARVRVELDRIEAERDGGVS
ncbi:MAG: hypothetical protein RIB60_05995 [Phycisphaerales bacterium]